MTHELVHAERQISRHYGKITWLLKKNKNSLNIGQQDHITCKENEDKIIRILNSNRLHLMKMQGWTKVGSQF